MNINKGEKLNLEEIQEILDYTKCELRNWHRDELLFNVYSVHSYYNEEGYRLQGYFKLEELKDKDSFYLPNGKIETVKGEEGVVLFITLLMPKK